MKILKAIAVGVGVGVIIGGVMAWKKNKEVQEKVDEIFDDEVINNIVEKTTEGLKDVNEQMQERTKEIWEDLEKTKVETMNAIKERHAKLDEEIKKMEESQKTTQTIDEIKEEAKAAVAEVVGQDENESDKEHREKIEKLQAETEKQLDDLLADLNK